MYAIFVLSVIPIFDSFNTFLQVEEPLIHVLCHSTLRLYRSLLSRFILLEVISESNDVLSIDLVDPDVLKDFNSVFISAMTKQYTRESDIIGTSEHNLIFLRLPESHQATLDELHVLIIFGLTIPFVWRKCLLTLFIFPKA